MTIDLDVLLSESDPVRRMASPGPNAPEFERIWRTIADRQSDALQHTRRVRRPLVFPALSLGAAGLAVLLIMVLLPTPGVRPTPSAAASLRSLADVAGTQEVATPTADQWLEQKATVSFSASVLSVGTTSTPDATAVVNASVDEWSNTATTTCTQSNFSPAQFVSPTNQEAWVAAGLLVTPLTPSISCAVGSPGSALGGGSGAFNISSLPADPMQLARVLQAGTIGIPSLDQLPPDEVGNSPGFARAVALLVGPTVGATPSFWSALLNAMATMKGVSALGTTTTHQGSTGLGFTTQTGLGQTTVVLSPSTGALLEARNFQDPTLQGSGDSFVNDSASHGIATEGGSTKIIFDWFDPVTGPNVVNALPASVQHQLPPSTGTTGFLQAGVVAGASITQLKSLVKAVQRFPGTSSAGFGPLPGHPDDLIFTVTMHGSARDEDGVQAVMKQSGLFAYVNENTRPTS